MSFLTNLELKPRISHTYISFSIESDLNGKYSIKYFRNLWLKILIPILGWQILDVNLYIIRNKVT